MNGLRIAYRDESAFRQEFWAAVFMIPAAFWLGQTWVEVALLVGSVLLVMIVELLNSGIETAVDRISYEVHDLSGRAKDLATAAVFLSLQLCLWIWAAALWHRFSA